ncbi:MAG: sugar ABC transporter substrate-binding protein [Actinobacteria bacterium]|nr:sugar ABC transporter substrate-binding protein [Actinomycetota bacterium]
MKRGLLLMAVTVVSLILVATLSFAGCKATPATETAAETTAAETSAEEVSTETPAETSAVAFKAGVVLPTMNVFYLALQNGVVGAIEEAGGEAIVLTSQQYKPAVELANVEDLIQQGIDVLFIDASDLVASSPSIELANKANVPVIGLNQRTESGKFVTVVATNNYEAGKLAAEFVMEQIEYKGEVAIINGPPVPAVLDRIKAFKDVVAQYPDVKIVADQMMGNTIAEGISVAENILQANPELDGFLGMNDFAFLGALTALQNANKVGEVAIGAIDGIPEVVQILAAGLAPKCATAAQLPVDIGKKAVQAYLDYRDGKDVPQDIQIDSILITKDNAQGFSW